MTQRLRHDRSGGSFHVMNRGIAQRTIFDTPKDRRLFLAKTVGNPAYERNVVHHTYENPLLARLCSSLAKGTSGKPRSLCHSSSRPLCSLRLRAFLNGGELRRRIRSVVALEAYASPSVPSIPDSRTPPNYSWSRA